MTRREGVVCALCSTLGGFAAVWAIFLWNPRLPRWARVDPSAFD